MRSISTAAFGCILMLNVASPAFGSVKVHRGPTSPRVVRARTLPARTVHKPVSAYGIEAGRAHEIQLALIKSGYLSGEPTGTWNEDTQAAMQKFQADNGWQSKLVPDSRAIIKLGLGSSITTPEASTATETHAPEAPQ